MTISFFVTVLTTPTLYLYARDVPKPELMLANVYHSGLDLNDYWLSEKYDGVRVIWDGEQLISRGGNIYHAPKWFTRDFPKQVLDGELWIARQRFELLLSTVRDRVPNDEAWKQVSFMVFDLPELKLSFNERLPRLNALITSVNVPWLKVVEQKKVSSHVELMKSLREITKKGAEGLMLHRGDSLYQAKRNGDLLKVKLYEDAEAIVLKHIKGKGKYENSMGALLVKTPEGKTFKIGTGFSDEERLNPPPIGSMITYRYQGRTKNGIPRFASYMRIRLVQ